MRESAEGAGICISAVTYGDEGKNRVTRGVKEGGRRILNMDLQDETQKRVEAQELLIRWNILNRMQVDRVL